MHTILSTPPLPTRSASVRCVGRSSGYYEHIQADANRCVCLAMMALCAALFCLALIDLRWLADGLLMAVPSR